MKRIVTVLFALAAVASVLAKPFLKSELIFPLEHWHNHGSCIVETSSGEFLVCWFHGSGERTADDVEILGAKLDPRTGNWYDDLKPLIEGIDFLTDADKQAIFSGNALSMHGERLSAKLGQPA